jgi:GntR family transcriptional regulator
MTQKSVALRRVPPLQRNSTIALHQQIYLIVRDIILSGRVGPGSALPAEEALVTMFEVSRVTIRKSLALLEDEKLIERRHGIGTFVSSRLLTETIRVAGEDHLQHMLWVGNSTSVQVLDVEWVAAPPAAATFFDADEGALLQRLVRVRTVQGKPVFHVVTYLPEALARDLKRSDFMNRSLSEILSKRGHAITSGRQSVTAVLADPVLAHRLSTKVGAALLMMRRYHYDEKRLPIEFSEVHAVPGAFELDLTLEPGSE